MVASATTVEQVAEVLREHVPRDLIEKICDELEKVPGNKSFRQTMELLVAELRRPRC
jgi:hypothetical protein